MGIPITLFLCNLLIPALVLVFGVWMRVRPPKRINGVFGYRTRMSRKNEQTWQFAHRICGKIWIVLGSVMLAVCTAVQIPLLRDTARLTRVTQVMSFGQIALILLSVAGVERALRKHFDQDGKSKK